MITQTKLENLAEKYEVEDFIKNDPIQFPHRFKNPEDIEIAAFISSLFAYGNRKIFIKKLDELFKIMQNKPLDFVLNFNPEKLKGFNYRFAKDFDIIEVFHILNKLYKQDKGLKALFEYGYLLPSPLAANPLLGELASRRREGVGLPIEEDEFQSEVRVLEIQVRGTKTSSNS